MQKKREKEEKKKFKFFFETGDRGNFESLLVKESLEKKPV